MNPFLPPCSNPNKMQKMYTQRYNNPSIMEKNTGDEENTSTFREKCFSVPWKERKFITEGCFKTGEVLFAAATNHMLAMFMHFKRLGPENSSPYKSGTKTTERIISELQAKTTQIQSLDCHPAVSDILNKISSAQFNQLAEDRLIQNGPKKQASTNRKRISHSGKAVKKKTYQYPKFFSVFR